MVARTLPGLGLTGYWDLGADGWKDAMDTNLRVLSVIAGGLVKSRVAALPGSPAAGDIYIVPSGAGSHPNEIAVYDGPTGSLAWVYLVPKKGSLFYVEDESKTYRWNGTAWVEFGDVKTSTVVEKTASYAAVAGDFTGMNTIKMNVATSNTLTIPSGLVVTEPLMVIQTGLGQTTIAAGVGVTIHTSETTKLRAQYSAVSLIPDGTDTYILVGDLELAP